MIGRSVEELSAVLISFHPGFFCIELVCEPANTQFIENVFVKDIATGWVRLIVTDQLVQTESEENDEGDEEMSGEQQ